MGRKHLGGEKNADAAINKDSLTHIYAVLKIELIFLERVYKLKHIFHRMTEGKKHLGHIDSTQSREMMYVYDSVEN